MKISKAISLKRVAQTEAIAAVTLFLAFAVYYGQLMYHNLWREESENILVARMMAQGDTLYRDIFSHHGPASFIVPFIMEKFCATSVVGHRFLVAGLWGFSLLSLLKSGVIQQASLRRLHCLCALTLPFVYLQDAFLYTQTYQVFVGTLLIPALSCVIFPSILDLSAISSRLYFLTGLFLGTLPFVAIYFLPPAVLLTIACISYRRLKPLAAGWTFSFVANISFLAMKGSLHGYYAYTIYLNYYILPEFMSNLTLSMRAKVIFCVMTSNLAAMLLSLLLMASLAVLGANEKSLFPWRSISAGLAIIMLAIRGDHCHSGPYLGCLIATSAVLFYSMPTRRLNTWPATFGVYLLLLTKLLQCILSPKGSLGKQSIAVDDYFTRAVAHFTQPDDMILAYPFHPNLYLQLRRRPASAYAVYFPWLARYAEKPVFGLHTDLIRDIETNRPKFIYSEIPPNWFGPYDFSASFREELHRRYTKLEEYGFWVRQDLPIDEIKSYLANK